MDGASGLGPGMTLGKYELLGLLGRGGMGEVWAARDPDLDRKVALKVLRSVVAGNDDARARLQREGRAMARLRHPNVITVHEAAFVDGRALIAMELVDGESLAQWLAVPRPPAEVVRVLVDAGRGLAAAHAAGMIHRDFKPHNVLVDRDGRVVVTDFGLARAAEVNDEDGYPSVDPQPAAEAAAADAPTAASGALDATVAPPAVNAALDATATPTAAGQAFAATATPPPRADAGAGDMFGETAAATPEPTPRSEKRSSKGDLSSPLTETGALLGTPAYMAPEQLRGEAADARCDQYAFCVTAWEAFTGERPFHGKTFDELVASVNRGDPGAGDKIPRRLRSILVRGMTRDPLGRWRSIDALLAAITRAWRRPKRIAIAAGAVAGVAGVVAVFLATRGGTTVVAGCGDPAAAVAPAWSPAIRAGVARAVSGTPDAARTLGYFDRWSATWRGAYENNCKKPSEPDFPARRACLESLRDALAPITSIGDKLDPAMFSRVDWPRPIADPAKCIDTPRALAPAPPADPALRAEVGRIRARMLAARAAILEGDVDPAVLSGLAADAGRTGYLPVIAEITLLSALFGEAGVDQSTADRAASCARFRDATTAATAAEHDLIALEALIRQIDCSFDLFAERSNLGEMEEILTRGEVLAARVGNAYHHEELARFHENLAYGRGQWNRALAADERQRELLLETGRSPVPADLGIARVRFLRHRGDDLAISERILRDWYATTKNPSPLYVADLRRILWHQGRFAEAPPLPEPPAPDLSDSVTIKIRTIAAGAPVAGVAIAATADLHADATRVAMEEIEPAVLATTGADGSVEVAVARNAVILARLGTRTGAAVVPPRGDVTIELVDGAAVSGTVGGLVEYPEDDPVTRADRARTRMLAVAILTTEIGGKPLAWEAPVSADGRWQLPAVLVPGRYVLTVQTISGLADDQAVQAVLALQPGPNTAPAMAFETTPRILEIVARPAMRANVVAFSGDGGRVAPRTWPELVARLETATSIALGPTELAEPDDRDTLPTDWIARVGGGPGPVTVCVLLDGIRYTGVALYLALEPQPDARAPRCKSATVTEPTTRILVTTDR